MTLVIDNSLDKLFGILKAFTQNLFAFCSSIIEFTTKPIHDIIYDFSNNDLPLGEFFGAPLRLVSDWLFTDDITLIGFLFGTGIAIYIVWSIAVWITNLVN